MAWPKGKPRGRTQPDECLVRRCNKRPMARGLCPTHYNYWWNWQAWAVRKQGSIGGNQERLKASVEEFVAGAKMLRQSNRGRKTQDRP